MSWYAVQLNDDRIFSEPDYILHGGLPGYYQYGRKSITGLHKFERSYMFKVSKNLEILPFVHLSITKKYYVTAINVIQKKKKH